MDTFLFHHLTREEITACARAGYAAVVPLAATEQHGKHLSVYTDSLIGEHISTEAVRKATAEGKAKLLLTPQLSIGCSSHHLAFGGTLSFSSETYLRMLKEIGESLIKDGFRKIIFINAHGGNANMMNQAAQDLAVQHPVWVASASYWNAAGDAMTSAREENRGMVAGHAGRFETSLMLALDERLVRKDLIPEEHTELDWIFGSRAGTFIGCHGKLTGADGYTDSSEAASAEQGQAYLAAIVDGVAQWFVECYATMEKECT
ncbi:creatininase family protein [Paenibacillus qinlingensis]|uniref:Creatinine amidohydrolase n=1 Tax=Paenibacillus qinlingensis TaxID=1837343 RepID=A0ABU1P0C5_9BACL|nr:creatininase family protein [Paenibacillus qinlingensis]MDR6553194.1 creatinine amidohydrolase [Paenibacillus qinlingensis]